MAKSTSTVTKSEMVEFIRKYPSMWYKRGYKPGCDIDIERSTIKGNGWMFFDDAGDCFRIWVPCDLDKISLADAKKRIDTAFARGSKKYNVTLEEPDHWSWYQMTRKRFELLDYIFEKSVGLGTSSDPKVAAAQAKLKAAQDQLLAVQKQIEDAQKDLVAAKKAATGPITLEPGVVLQNEHVFLEFDDKFDQVDTSLNCNCCIDDPDDDDKSENGIDTVIKELNDRIKDHQKFITLLQKAKAKGAKWVVNTCGCDYPKNFFPDED